MYNYETSNQSFLDLHDRLDRLCINNNKQFLLLKNKELLNVDPWDPNITETQKADIIQECNDNIWYYLREVVRIPTDTFDKGIIHTPFYINIGIFVMIFLWINGFNQFTCMPASMFKTGSICALYSYLRNIFGLSMSNISVTSPTDLKTKSIKNKVRKYLVPDYVKSGFDTGNKEKHILLDNFTNIPNNFKEWNKIRDKDNIVLLSTAGDLHTESGRFAFQLKNTAADWKTEYLDAKKKYLEELYNNADDKLFYVEYNAEALLVDPSIICEKSGISIYCEHPDIIAREVNLIWK
jgi:hypothetical protein